MTPAKQLEEISKVTHDFMNDQYRTYNNSLIPALKKEGIAILSHYEDLSQKQAKFVDDYFKSEVYPVLTPMAVDSSRPFPLIRNRSLNIGAILKMKTTTAGASGNGHFRELYITHNGAKKEGASDTDFATVQVPSGLPRVVEIPSEDGFDRTYIMLEQIIERNIHRLFLMP